MLTLDSRRTGTFENINSVVLKDSSCDFQVVQGVRINLELAESLSVLPLSYKICFLCPRPAIDPLNGVHVVQRSNN